MLVNRVAPHALGEVRISRVGIGRGRGGDRSSSPVGLRVGRVAFLGESAVRKSTGAGKDRVGDRQSERNGGTAEVEETGRRWRGDAGANADARRRGKSSKYKQSRRLGRKRKRKEKEKNRVEEESWMG